MLSGDTPAEVRRFQIKSFIRDDTNKLKLIFVSYGLAGTMLKELQKFAPTFVAMDESQNLKGRTSAVSRNVRKVSLQADYRVAMSGTPAPQGWEDYWAQYDITSPEVFGKWTDFRDRYCKTGHFGANQITGYKHEDELERTIKETCYRVRLEDVADIIPMTNVIHSVKMGKNTKKYYTQMEKEEAISLDVKYTRDELKEICREHGIKYKPWDSYRTLYLSAYDAMQLDEVSSDRVITMYTKLHQITGGFVIMDTGKVAEIGVDKLIATKELLASFTEEDTTLIFCNYRAEIKGIAKYLKKLGYRVGVHSKRKKTIKKFWKGKYNVYILQIGSGGVGLNLQQANRMIFYSINFRSDQYKQAMHRTYRTGQKRAVQAFNLITEESIDEDIYKSVQRKLRRSRRIL